MNNFLFNQSTILKLLLIIIFLNGMHGLYPKLYAIDLMEMDLDLEVNKLSGSNIFNQILWIGTLIISVFLLIKQKNFDWNILRSKYFFTLYLISITILFSSIFSEHFDVSLKRIALFFISLISLFIIVYLSENRFKVFDVLIFCFFIVFAWDLLSIITFNGIDIDGYFRGVHGQKNSAGMIYSYFFIYFINRLKYSFSKLDLICLILSIGLLLLSSSKTAICISFLYIFLSRYPRLFTRIIPVLIVVLPLLVLAFLLDFYDLPDDTLTGRGEIWEFLRYYSDDFLWSGMGFGSFWGVGEGAENIVYGYGYIQMINNAHNGYYDAAISGGVILLLLIPFQFLLHFFMLEKCNNYKYSYFCGFCLFSLIIGNVTESTLFYAQFIAWNIYLVSFFCILNCKLNYVRLN